MAETVVILKKEIRYYKDDDAIKILADEYEATRIETSAEKVIATFKCAEDAQKFKVAVTVLWPYT